LAGRRLLTLHLWSTLLLMFLFLALLHLLLLLHVFLPQILELQLVLLL
jgi:hypothetical protein